MGTTGYSGAASPAPSLGSAAPPDPHYSHYHHNRLSGGGPRGHHHLHHPAVGPPGPQPHSQMGTPTPTPVRAFPAPHHHEAAHLLNANQFALSGSHGSSTGHSGSHSGVASPALGMLATVGIPQRAAQ